jgi:hypothetical protein
MLNKKDFGEGAASLRAVDQRNAVFDPEAREDRAERLAGFDRADRQRFMVRKMSAMVSLVPRGAGMGLRPDGLSMV